MFYNNNVIYYTVSQQNIKVKGGIPLNFNKKKFKTLVLAFIIVALLTASSIPSHAALGDRLLRRGSRGNDVKVLQETLNQLGHNCGTADGVFGGLTYNGVLSFQRSKGLSTDGIVGSQTIDAINGNKPSKTPTQTKPNTPSRSPAPAKPVAVTTSRLLKLGTRGKDVQALQNSLNRLGYNCGKADGIFGSLTYNAVVNYQKTQGLSTDGVAGPKTANAINGISYSKPKPSIPNRGGNDNDIGTNIVGTAKKYLGTPYLYGGSSTSGFDCSGFVQFAYRQLDINVPRTSVAQASTGTTVARADLKTGDLVVFSNTYRSGPSHTGIYLGGNQFIHSSSSGKGVIISNLNSSYYNNHFSYGRRVY